MSQRSNPLSLLTAGFLLSAGLIACSPAEKASAPAETPQQAAPAPQLQWLEIAKTPEGGAITFDPTSVKKDATTGFTDIVAKVRYDSFSTWLLDSPKYRETISLKEERVTLRYDCAGGRVAVIKREALNDKGGLIETIDAPFTPDSLQPIKAGGVAQAAASRACPAP